MPEVAPTPLPTPPNAILLQGFEWYCKEDGKHYKRLLSQIEQLKAHGVQNIWLPPGCKAASPQGNGYDCYDLYDLGEFDQKGATRTKWGTKEDLIALGTKVCAHVDAISRVLVRVLMRALCDRRQRSWA